MKQPENNGLFEVAGGEKAKGTWIQLYATYHIPDRRRRNGMGRLARSA